jgi:hypothetical protein
VPGFVDLAGRNLRLLSNSTCINSGNNAFAPSGLDLDANVRIRGNTVDIGAYEFQNPMSGLSYAWLQKYGLPIDGSLDFADTDGDGFSNWQEWIADTSPIDPLSFLKILTPTRTNSPPGVLVRWQGTSTNRTYFLQRATNLALASPFSVIKTNISPTNGLASFVDTNTSGAGPYFYRVGVQR